MRGVIFPNDMVAVIWVFHFSINNSPILNKDQIT